MKKLISLSLAIIMTVIIYLPAGTAFANDVVTPSNEYRIDVSISDSSTAQTDIQAALNEANNLETYNDANGTTYDTVAVVISSPVSGVVTEYEIPQHLNIYSNTHLYLN